MKKCLKCKQTLTGFVSLIVIIAAVAFLVYAANVTCPAGGGLCTTANGATADPTNGPDNIVGGTGADIIFALGGDDVVAGGDETDGGDTIFGGPGRDLINGGGGSDTIRGGLGDDRLNGDAGDDAIGDDNGNGLCEPGEELGRDRIFGGPAATSGNDTICGGDQDDFIDGGDGNDVLQGGRGNDQIFGGDGDDTIGFNFTAGAVTPANALGLCVFGEEPGNDVINGGDGSNVICGGDGNDIISSGVGSDTIVDGRGFDRISSGDEQTGGDTIYLVGDNLSDRVNAGDGDDTINLDPNSGADVISCGPGNDIVNLNGNAKARHANVQNLMQIANGVIPNLTDCETINP